MPPSFRLLRAQGCRTHLDRRFPDQALPPLHVETPTESTACSAIMASLHAEEEPEARLGPPGDSWTLRAQRWSKGSLCLVEPTWSRGFEDSISGAQDVPGLQVLSSEVTPPWLSGKLHPFPWALSCVTSHRRCPSSDGPAPLPPKQHEDPDSRLTFQCSFLDAPSATSESQE